MHHSALLASLLVISAVPTQALAQDAPSPAPQPTLQQRFDAATAAFGDNDCARAVPLFNALAQEHPFRPGTMAGAAMAVRQGLCLVRLGRADEGEPLVANGLPKLETADASFQSEVAEAHEMLGVLAMTRWDRDLAIDHFRRSLSFKKGPDRLTSLARLAQATAFDNDETGLAAAREGLAITIAATKSDRKLQSTWHTLIGRILLNRGQTKEGLAELKLALSTAGGLTDIVTAPMAQLRADLAQAYMLTNNRQDAYRLLAASGAGRVMNTPFSAAKRMQPPPCGPDTGLTPDDSAVVEFAIAETGEVLGAQPIYARGDYAKAAAFARAVSEWNWAPEDAANIPAFYRYSSRVELRCTRGEGQGGANPAEPLTIRFNGWAQQALGRFAPTGGPSTRWPQALAAADAAAGAGDRPAELAARVWLAMVDLRRPSELVANIDRAEALATDPALPAQARAAARVLLAKARAQIPPAKSNRRTWRERDLAGAAALTSLADDPEIAGDALAQATALLLALSTSKGDPSVVPMATRVANEDRLAAHHPLRQYAQLRLANEAAAANDLAAAQTWFAATGLNEQQCALIGPKPARTSMRSVTFPDEALAFGFEGWVIVEFDVAADGSTTGPRSVIAYPPFVFNETSTKALAGAKYQSSYRPSGGQACSANLEKMRYVIPGNQNVPRVVPAKKKS